MATYGLMPLRRVLFQLVIFFLVCVNFRTLDAEAKIESETAQSAEENAKDKGGLLDEEYAEINFADDVDPEDVSEDRFLPENMLSVVFNIKEKCFFEDIPAGSILRGAWFVTSSDASPIRIKVKRLGSSDKVLYDEVESEDTGGFTVNADVAGTHSYCFESVDYPTATELVMTFAVDVASAHAPKGPSSAGKPEHVYPLQRSTSNMYNTLQSLVSELEVILIRVDRHVLTQDSTELRVWLLTALESLAIAGITAFQIYFVRRLVNKSKQWV
jgi:hypothetical protein